MYCALPKNTTCPDVVIADTAVGYLQQWEAEKAAGTQHKPFFVGMGIHKVSLKIRTTTSGCILLCTALHFLFLCLRWLLRAWR
jgi:hypothetical protein